MSSRRLSLQGGFLLAYGSDKLVFASFQAPAESIRASLRAATPESEWNETPLRGPLSSALLAAAQRNDDPVIDIAGREYAVGMAADASGKIVVAVLPMPQD
ncbi:MAG: hypothetical protein WDM87_15245 [Terracidiphilus sp.]